MRPCTKGARHWRTASTAATARCDSIAQADEHPRRRLGRRLVIFVVIGLLLGIALFDIPLSYEILAPGHARDLTTVIVVPGHTPPPTKMYLTDVSVMRATPALWLAAKAAPQTLQLVERSRVVPPNTTDRQYTTQLDEMMKSSQMTAQVVAERAAGLPVRIESSVRVAGTKRGTPAARCFRLGERVLSIGGRHVERVADVQRVTRARPPGTRFTLVVEDGRKRRTISCSTYADGRVPRFGVLLREFVEAYKLPVTVRYDLPQVNGPSAGLMFALEIYRVLTGKDITGKHDVAGTGVLSLDGAVTPIEGARQKIAAAKRAGASVFLIPKDNERDVAGTTGIRVIPVRSFDDAVKALSALAREPAGTEG